MKNIERTLFAIVILTATAFVMTKASYWNITDGYSIKFNSANFKGLKASIRFDEANPGSSKISASIDARTFNSGNKLMDAHAKEIDALNAERFPFITFESTAIKKTADGYEATGDLTLKGITKEIKFPFIFDSQKPSAKFPFNPKETFKGAITIIAKDFNITRSGTPPEIRIELEIPVKQSVN